MPRANASLAFSSLGLLAAGYLGRELTGIEQTSLPWYAPRHPPARARPGLAAPHPPSCRGLRTRLAAKGCATAALGATTGIRCPPAAPVRPSR